MIVKEIKSSFIFYLSENQIYIQYYEVVNV